MGMSSLKCNHQLRARHDYQELTPPGQALSNTHAVLSQFDFAVFRCVQFFSILILFSSQTAMLQFYPNLKTSTRKKSENVMQRRKVPRTDDTFLSHTQISARELATMVHMAPSNLHLRCPHIYLLFHFFHSLQKYSQTISSVSTVGRKRAVRKY